MVCSLRSSRTSSCNEATCLSASKLEIVPKMIYLQNIDIPVDKTSFFDIESKFCIHCRKAYSETNEDEADLRHLYNILCGPCSEILVDFAKNTLSASSNNVESRSSSLSSLLTIRPVKKRMRILGQESFNLGNEIQIENDQNTFNQLEPTAIPLSSSYWEPSDVECDSEEAYHSCHETLLETDGKDKIVKSTSKKIDNGADQMKQDYSSTAVLMENITPRNAGSFNSSETQNNIEEDSIVSSSETPTKELERETPESSAIFPTSSSIVVLLNAQNAEDSEYSPPKFASSKTPSIFHRFHETETDWCRYCGTTNGVNWRPGPWGRRTLCNRHGCDYKGYGFNAHKPTLDLSAFYSEDIKDRKIPVLKEYCMYCLSNVSTKSNTIIMCHGCTRSYHIPCFKQLNPSIPKQCIFSDGKPWFCSLECINNLKTLTLYIDLPKRGLPFNKAKCKASHTLTCSNPVRKFKPNPSNFYTSSATSIKKMRELSDSFVYDSEIIKLSHDSLEHTCISLPNWSIYESLSHLDDDVRNEDISDDAFLTRHRSLEDFEKTTRVILGVNNETQIK